MRIAVVGAGAMGSIYGASLQRGGAMVTLVDVSSPLVERLQTEGLVITRGEAPASYSIPATTDAAAVGPVDVVLFFVKGYQTAAAAELAAPLVGPTTIVATLQNGWGNGEILACRFPQAAVVIGVSYHSGTVTGLGQIVHSNLSNAPTWLGPHSGDDLAPSRWLADAIRAGGFLAEATPEVKTEIWKKLTLNAAALPTSALTGYSAGALAEDAAMMGVVDALARESVAVGQALGFPVDLNERLETIHSALLAAGTGKASMLQDIEAGRRTEIDTVNGAVVRAAREQGLDTPVNDVMVALVKGYEQAHGLA